MSPPLFSNVTVYTLPEDLGLAMQSGGTWRREPDRTIVIVCPKCWTERHRYHQSGIDHDTRTIRLVCKCGLDNPCKLAGFGLKGGTD